MIKAQEITFFSNSHILFFVQQESMQVLNKVSGAIIKEGNSGFQSFAG